MIAPRFQQPLITPTMNTSLIRNATILLMLFLTLLTACSRPTTGPTAVIIAPNHVEAGHVITVDAANSTAGSTPIVSYAWDMGDGAIAFAPTINYSYGAAGEYDITLTVTDETGLSHTTSHRLEVTQIPEATPPTAVIEGPTTALVGETVTFSAANTQVGSGSVSKFQWQSGDGPNTGDTIEATLTTSYAKPGTYAPIITVIDNKGLSDSASMEIVVRKATP